MRPLEKYIKESCTEQAIKLIENYIKGEDEIDKEISKKPSMLINTVFRVKNHLCQFGSDVRVPTYYEADPNYPSAKLLNFQEITLQRRRDYYQEIVEQQKFSH